MKLFHTFQSIVGLLGSGLHSRYLALALTAFVFAFPDYARGQSATGSITGIVTDAQSAVVPGADVTATNAQTGVAAKTRTNEVGVYNIPYLKPGTYEVRI